jgi:DNA modification methylase
MDIPNSLFNCDCLTLAERLPNESVDLVYLDPPWNTASEFQHVDVGKVVTDTKPSSNYDVFLLERMGHFYRVLKKTGSLFIHLDPAKSTSVKLILNQAFGEENYRNQYILPRNTVRFDINSPYFDYTEILFYSKSDNFAYTPILRPFSDEEIQNKYLSQDEKGYYRLQSLISLNRDGLRYEWQGITPDEGHSWRVSKRRLDELFDEGLISLDLSRNLPALKKYIDPGFPIGCIWNDLQPSLALRESTGIFSQQSSELLSRIIKISTKEGAIVFDPFCGSATTLVSAEAMKRKWIGCDIAENAYQIALKRLYDQLGLRLGKDFKYGNENSVRSYFKKIYKPHHIKAPNTETSDVRPDSQVAPDKVEVHEEYQGKPEKIIPFVITEGKTDWKHLKAAYLRLKSSGFLPDDFLIEFMEFENGVEMGDSKLLEMCRSYALANQARKTIFIFDRDKDSTVKDVSDQTLGFKDWTNNVYSFAIPIPLHRLDNPAISIEFYYTDRDIIRKDKNGRRLFFTSEFNPTSGWHNEDDLVCHELNKIRGSKKVLDSMVYNKKNENVALSKNDYAINILNGIDGFDDLDIYEFSNIFEIIQLIQDR